MTIIHLKSFYSVERDWKIILDFRYVRNFAEDDRSLFKSIVLPYIWKSEGKRAKSWSTNPKIETKMEQRLTMSLYSKLRAAMLYNEETSQTTSVQHCCTVKSLPKAVNIRQVQCSSVVQISLFPQQSLYGKFSAARLYKQDSSHSSH